MLIRKNNEISEVLFPEGTILRNTYRLNNTDKYQIFAVLIRNGDTGRQSRYFVIQESNHFPWIVPMKKLSQLMSMRDEFDYVLMLYTQPSLVKLIPFIGKFTERLSNDLIKSNSQFLFERLFKNIDNSLRKIGIQPYKHLLVSRTSLISLEFKNHYIKKEFQDMGWHTEWNSNLVENRAV